MSQVTVNGKQKRLSYRYPESMDTELAQLAMLESIRNCAESVLAELTAIRNDFNKSLNLMVSEARRTRIVVERAERRYLRERRKKGTDD